MSRKIQILLPDGVAKRTIIAGVDAQKKWGQNLYLEVFCLGLGELEKQLKTKGANAPAATTTKKEKK